MKSKSKKICEVRPYTRPTVANSKKDFFHKKIMTRGWMQELLVRKIKIMNNSLLIKKHLVLCVNF